MFKKISYDVHKRERFHIESINIKILSINMSFFVSSTNNSTPITSSIFFLSLKISIEFYYNKEKKILWSQLRRKFWHYKSFFAMFS